MKKRVIIIIASIILIALICYVLSGIFGTPWGKHEAEIKYEQYIEDNIYNDIDCKVYYSFLTSEYQADCYVNIDSEIILFHLIGAEDDNIGIVAQDEALTGIMEKLDWKK